RRDLALATREVRARRVDTFDRRGATTLTVDEEGLAPCGGSARGVLATAPGKDTRSVCRGLTCEAEGAELLQLVGDRQEHGAVPVGDRAHVTGEQCGQGRIGPGRERLDRR